jgi:hypothetical protein
MHDLTLGYYETSRYLLFDETNRLCGWRNTKTGEEKIAVPRNKFVEKAYSCVVVFEYDIFRLMEVNNFTGPRAYLRRC